MSQPAAIGLTASSTAFVLTAAIGLTASAAMVLSGSPGLGGYDLSELFGWHAILMVFALLFLMPAGLVVYSFDLPAFASRFPNRASRKPLHYGLQTAAFLCILAAYGFAYIAHERSGKEHLALHAKLFSRTVHVWTGLAVIAALIYQASGGWVKVFTPPRRRLFSSHSKIGLYVWLAALFPLVLAAYFRWFVKAESSLLALTFLACILANAAAVYWWLDKAVPPTAAPPSAPAAPSQQRESPTTSSNGTAVVTRRSPAIPLNTAPGDDEEERKGLISSLPDQRVAQPTNTEG